MCRRGGQRGVQQVLEIIVVEWLSIEHTTVLSPASDRRLATYIFKISVV